MSNPNPKRQKVARRELDDLFAKADQITVIHYSCESFYNRPEGMSPRITSIALEETEFRANQILFDPPNSRDSRILFGHDQGPIRLPRKGDADQFLHIPVKLPR